MTESDAQTFVKRVGKPFSEVYDIALRGKDPARTIMIGDALETDITGGLNAGCATLWVVKDGIHSKDAEKTGPMAVVDGFNGSYGTYAYGEKVMPEYVVDNFRW